MSSNGAPSNDFVFQDKRITSGTFQYKCWENILRADRWISNARYVMARWSGVMDWLLDSKQPSEQVLPLPERSTDCPDPSSIFSIESHLNRMTAHAFTDEQARMRLRTGSGKRQFPAYEACHLMVSTKPSWEALELAPWSFLTLAFNLKMWQSFYKSWHNAQRGKIEAFSPNFPWFDEAARVSVKEAKCMWDSHRAANKVVGDPFGLTALIWFVSTGFLKGQIACLDPNTDVTATRTAYSALWTSRLRKKLHPIDWVQLGTYLLSTLMNLEEFDKDLTTLTPDECLHLTRMGLAYLTPLQSYDVVSAYTEDTHPGYETFVQVMYPFSILGQSTHMHKSPEAAWEEVAASEDVSAMINSQDSRKQIRLDAIKGFSAIKGSNTDMGQRLPPGPSTRHGIVGQAEQKEDQKGDT